MGTATTRPSIIWFRQDLRLRDNPALHAAAERGQPLIPLYIWCPEEEGAWPPGAASRWWLHHSLCSLDAQLRELGLRLILRAGPALQGLRSVIAASSASAVYWNRRYEPAARECSARVKRELRRDGIEALSFNGSLLAEPREWLNQTGKPYQVYTPFLRNLQRSLQPAPALEVPRALAAPVRWPDTLALDAFALLPKVAWYAGMAASAQPGEGGALLRLREFLHSRLEAYERTRDVPAVPGTSGLSPHLHFGEIGPRQIWHALGVEGRRSTFLRELIWREFGYHLLYHFPHTAQAPLRAQFAHFAWQHDASWLAAWQSGRTGVPMVDAGMRELWHSGVMHNRVRMITASFLVKNLRQSWLTGARWFWDTLLDADLASNTLNWQWVAGCGADAAPYYRIFNPVLQGQRFDSQGAYIRRWLPELAQCEGRHCHAPWLSQPPPAAYPAPIVDLAASRQAALDAYQLMRAAASDDAPNTHSG
jgi:deoxyribodipyrimidine photo-lyase